MSKVFKAKVPEGRGMDIARTRKLQVPRSSYIVLTALALVSCLVWMLNPLLADKMLPIVDKSAIVTDVVNRGLLIRSVTAHGVFVSRNLRIVSSSQSGVVDRILVKPGDRVEAGAVIAKLENQSMRVAAINAEANVRLARAAVSDAEQQAKAIIVQQHTKLNDAMDQAQEDHFQVESDSKLYEHGLISRLAYSLQRLKAHRSADDVREAKVQVDVSEADGKAKMAVALAQLDEAAALAVATREQLSMLTVRAASAGLVQSISVEPGASVGANTEIARVADERDLKAVLNVAESDLHDVRPGLQARIDTGNSSIIGQVMSVAPSAKDGTVAVDVTFAHSLPVEARPATNVEGTIILTKMSNVVSIARPAGAADYSNVDLFKLVNNGSEALRVHVHLGQGSSSRLQVLDGLRAGDTVIVSDMSAYLGEPRLRLR